MMHDLMLRNMDFWENQDRDDPVLIEKMGTRVRGSGGKYTTTTPSLLGSIAAVKQTAMGSMKVSPQEQGTKYLGTQKYHAVMEDMVNLGITKQDTSLLRLYHDGQMFRVMNQLWLNRHDTIVLECTRMVEPYPTFTKKYDFEADTVGEDPTDWEITEPTGSTVNIVQDDTKAIEVYSNSAAKPRACLPVLGAILTHPREISFKIKLQEAAADGTVGTIYLGEASHEEVYVAGTTYLKMDLKVVDGVLHLVSTGDFDTTVYSWTTVIVRRELSTHALGVWINGVYVLAGKDVSAKTGNMVNFLFIGSGTIVNKIRIDDVEVKAL